MYYQIEGVKWLTGNDVSRWCIVQNKDLTKINQHLTQLMSNIEPLQNELQAEKKQRQLADDRMNEAERKAKVERETQRIQQKQYEKRIKELERSNQTEMERQKTEYNTLSESREKISADYEQLKIELSQNKQKIRDLGEFDISLTLSVAQGS